MSGVLEAMRDPGFYGMPATTAVDIRETHASIVFLAAGRAYKVKKPVRLGFLDYGSLAERRRLCAEELRVNRRFAPDVYLGLRAIVRTEEGFALAGPDAPEAVEFAVEMRRFDETRTLERLVAAGRADTHLAERAGRRIAELHETAPAVPGGGPEEIARRVSDNFEVLSANPGVVDPQVLGAVRAFAETFMTANHALFLERAAAGRVRDGHGDLRAEHVVVENGLVIVDAIEFDERLRQIDVASDLAFVVMDLERLGARDLAEALVRSYVETSGDHGVGALTPFFACYRACVRAKVGCIRLRQLDPQAGERPALESGVRSLAALALRFAWRSRLPLAVVMCGVAGSGKSTLALEMTERTGLPRVSSDSVRKELAGLRPDERGGAELYSAEHTERTYAELGARAARAAREEGGAIVDATFHRRAERRRLAAALADTGARILWCECRASEEELRRRAHLRGRAPEHGSDATWEVIAHQLRSFEPLDEVPATDHIVVDTGRDVDGSLAQLEHGVSRAIDSTPRSTGIP